MKYRKKPVVIEAIQYNGEVILFNVPKWLSDAQRKGVIYFKDCKPEECYIKTLEGDMHVSIGDYIIQGINGELYACKPDIFAKTYEAVE